MQNLFLKIKLILCYYEAKNFKLKMCKKKKVLLFELIGKIDVLMS